jgi:hypothetical protein
MKGLMCRHGQLVFLHSPFIRKFAATLLMFSVFILQCGCCRSCVVLVCVSLFRWVDFLCFGERIVCLMVTCLEGW